MPTTLTAEGVDALRARPDAEPEPPTRADVYAGPDDATPVEIVVPVEVPDDYDDDRRRWLTYRQHDVIAEVEYLFGAMNVRVDGPSVWVPWSAKLVRESRTFADAVAAGCGLFETVFVEGCWIDTTNLGA